MHSSFIKRYKNSNHNMITYSKKYISTSLIFLILSLILHSHLHFHACHGNHSTAVFFKKDNGHHFSNECDKCLTQISKIETHLSSAEIFENSPRSFKYKAQDNSNTFFLFKLYSRPPPIFSA